MIKTQTDFINFIMKYIWNIQHYFFVGLFKFSVEKDGGITVVFYLKDSSFSIGTTIKEEDYQTTVVEIQSFVLDCYINYEWDWKSLRRKQLADLLGLSDRETKVVIEGIFRRLRRRDAKQLLQ